MPGSEWILFQLADIEDPELKQLIAGAPTQRAFVVSIAFWFAVGLSICDALLTTNKPQPSLVGYTWVV